MTKIEHLEQVATWASAAMARRDAYSALLEAGRGNLEEYDWHDKRDAAWDEVKSADAMLKASLKALEEAKSHEILKEIFDPPGGKDITK